MSSFNPANLIDSVITKAGSTKLIPCPVGVYAATIDSKKIEQWSSKDGSKAGLRLDVLWEIQDPEVAAITGRAKVTVKQGVMLDLTEDGEALDLSEGKNIGLGRLRAALGMNQDGQPFSFNMLDGAMAKVQVAHRPNANDPTVVYDEVKSVAAL